MLQTHGIPVPPHVVVNRDADGNLCADSASFEETDDTVQVRGAFVVGCSIDCSVYASPRPTERRVACLTQPGPQLRRWGA